MKKSDVSKFSEPDLMRDQTYDLSVFVFTSNNQFIKVCIFNR